MKLAVCKACGWHLGKTHQCWPEAGAAADRLAWSVEVKSTKLGYGEHNLTFLFDRNHSMTVSVDQAGTFRVERLFWLGRYPSASWRELKELVEMLSACVPPRRT